MTKPIDRRVVAIRERLAQAEANIKLAEAYDPDYLYTDTLARDMVPDVHALLSMLAAPTLRPDADLDAMQAVCDAATPGTWFYNGYSAVFTAFCALTGIDQCWMNGHHPFDADNEPIDEDQCIRPLAWVPADHGDTAVGEHRANAEFIAAARQGWPATITALREARARIAALESTQSQEPPSSPLIIRDLRQSVGFTIEPDDTLLY